MIPGDKNIEWNSMDIGPGNREIIFEKKVRYAEVGP